MSVYKSVEYASCRILYDTIYILYLQAADRVSDLITLGEGYQIRTSTFRLSPRGTPNPSSEYL
jgi:hypothetical protein